MSDIWIFVYRKILLLLLYMCVLREEKKHICTVTVKNSKIKNRNKNLNLHFVIDDFATPASSLTLRKKKDIQFLQATNKKWQLLSRFRR